MASPNPGISFASSSKITARSHRWNNEEEELEDKDAAAEVAGCNACVAAKEEKEEEDEEEEEGLAVIAVGALDRCSFLHSMRWLAAHARSEWDMARL